MVIIERDSYNPPDAQIRWPHRPISRTFFASPYRSLPWAPRRRLLRVGVCSGQVTRPSSREGEGEANARSRAERWVLLRTSRSNAQIGASRVSTRFIDTSFSCGHRTAFRGLHASKSCSANAPRGRTCHVTCGLTLQQAVLSAIPVAPVVK